MAEIKLVKKVTINEEKPYSIVVTHGDLDGITSATIVSVGLNAYKRNHIILSSLDPTAKTTEEMILEAHKLVDGNVCGVIYILDRDIYNPEFKDTYEIHHTHWADHHKTSIEKYLPRRREYMPFISTHLTDSPELAGVNGAKRIAWELLDLAEIDTMDAKFDEWIKLVALWDTFSWKKDPKSDEARKAKKLAYASYILTPSMLYDIIMEGTVDDYRITFASEIYRSKFVDACTTALMSGKTCSMKGYNFMVLTDVVPEFISMIADYCFDTYENMDVVLCIGNGLVSTRVRQESDFDASNLMKQLGSKYGFSGGGHVKAAGCKYKEVAINSAEDRKDILDTIRGILG